MHPLLIFSSRAFGNGDSLHMFPVPVKEPLVGSFCQSSASTGWMYFKFAGVQFPREDFHGRLQRFLIGFGSGFAAGRFKNSTSVQVALCAAGYVCYAFLQFQDTATLLQIQLSDTVSCPYLFIPKVMISVSIHYFVDFS